MTDLRARVKGWLEQPYRPSAEPLASTMLVRDLLAEVERLQGVIDRAVAVGSDPDDWDNAYEAYKDMKRILQEAKLHD